MITCAYCQRLVKDGSRFCDHCGRPVLTADILRVESESSSRCPKGVSAKNCPGGGVPEKCRWYDKKGNKCYYITDWPPDRLASKYASIETEKLKPEKPDELNQLYLDLQRAYDATLDRRKTLTSQAANMMSFGGDHQYRAHRLNDIARHKQRCTNHSPAVAPLHWNLGDGRNWFLFIHPDCRFFALGF